MNTKTLAFAVAACLLFGMAAAQTQTQQTDPGPDAETLSSSSLQAILVNTDPAPVQSGEDAEITFKLRNTGFSKSEDVKVQVVDSFPFSLKPDRKRNYTLGDISPGEEYQITSEVLIADDAPDGMNDFKVRVHREDISYTLNVLVQVQSQDIELNLANLQTSPSQLTPDTEDAKMTVEVVNNGEKTAENAVVDIELPESFQETSSFSTRQALGNIRPGQVKPATFNFDVEEDAETGDVSIPTEISYSTDSDDSSSRITEDTDFEFYLTGKPQFQVLDTESNLKVGGENQLRVKVRNTGSEKSSSTRIRVLDSSDMPFSYGSSSQYIGTLEPNQTGTAAFDIETETEATAKDYLLDFEIRGVKDTQVYVEDTTVQAAVEQGNQENGGSPLPLIAVILVAAGSVYYFRNRIRELLNR